MPTRVPGRPPGSGGVPVLLGTPQDTKYLFPTYPRYMHPGPGPEMPRPINGVRVTHLGLAGRRAVIERNLGVAEWWN